MRSPPIDSESLYLTTFACAALCVVDRFSSDCTSSVNSQFRCSARQPDVMAVLSPSGRTIPDLCIAEAWTRSRQLGFLLLALLILLFASRASNQLVPSDRKPTSHLKSSSYFKKFFSRWPTGHYPPHVLTECSASSASGCLLTALTVNIRCMHITTKLPTNLLVGMQVTKGNLRNVLLCW